MVNVRSTYPGDIAELIVLMRESDRRELRAAHGDRSPHDIVREAYGLTPQPKTARTDDGHMLALFGVVPVGPILTAVGAPWMLATQRLDRYPSKLMSISRDYIAMMHERYPVMINYVDARNNASIRYLKRLGFTIDDPKPFGYAGLPFHRFHLGLSNV